MTNNYPNGQVLMPIETYNELMAEIAKAKAELTKVKSYFKLQKRNWSNGLDLNIDAGYVAQIAKELYTGSEFDGAFTIYSAEDIYNASITVGDPIPVEEPEPAADADATPTPTPAEDPNW